MIIELQDLQAQLRALNIRFADIKKDERAVYLAAVQEHVEPYDITEDGFVTLTGLVRWPGQTLPGNLSEWPSLDPSTAATVIPLP
ncbi:hypothetical protein [Burkholderia ubonensis]|uniref:hypothetical protein n=1 Tax=Burkholderia ubonensis TaxID=101571 RepID=UPI001E36C5FE|nr:hypothetical protein [Burkholderia ubonensis]